MTIGWFGEDAWEWVRGAASSVEKTVAAGWRAIPGTEWVDDATGAATGVVGDFARGPLRDFANTGVGETVLRAVSVTLGTMALAVPYVGIALMFASWSIPGMARGEEFDEAMIREFIYRVEQVAEYFAGEAGESVGKEVGKEMGEEFAKGAQHLREEAQKRFPGISVDAAIDMLRVELDITPARLAELLDIREDVAAYLLAWWRRMNAPDPNAYDVRTGRRRTLAERSRSGVDARAVYRDVEGFAGRVARMRATRGAIDPATLEVAMTFASRDFIPEERAPVAMRATEPVQRSRVGDYVLAGTVLAAAAALYAWHRGAL